MTIANENIEARVAQHTTRGRIQATVLAIIGVAGIIAVGVVAPNAAGVLAKYGTKIIKKANAKQNITAAIKTLRRSGKITVINGHYELTDAGRIDFQKYTARAKQAIQMDTHQKWDGKWRIVMFDVDERYRKRRDQLRVMLQAFGFQQLQKSVWVYPYPCEELVTLLQIELRVRREAVYLVADAIQGEEKWLRAFSLSKK